MKYSVPIRKILERAKAQNERAQTGGIAQMLGEMTRMALASEAFDVILTTRDPTKTDASHLKSIHDASKKLAGAAAKSRAEADRILSEAGYAIGQKLREETKLTDGPRGPEIRSALRAMSQADRNSLLLSAMKSNDSETLAAMLDAPAYLAGIHREHQATMRATYEEQVAPHLVREMDALLDTHQSAVAMTRAAERAAQEAQKADAVHKISEAEQAAINAMKELDAATKH